MVNNFELIKSLLRFDSPEDFYFIQILQRKKDNPGLEKHVRVISDLYIYSVDELEKKAEYIIELCQTKNARAYIRLNRRNSKTIALQMIKKVTDLVIQGNYKAIKSAYPSIVGEFHSDPDKTWIIDIDFKDFEGKESDLPQLHNDILELQKQTKKEPLMIEVPTKNGYHLIVRPFNANQFAKKWSVDIKKDNPSNLYTP